MEISTDDLQQLVQETLKPKPGQGVQVFTAIDGVVWVSTTWAISRRRVRAFQNAFYLETGWLPLMIVYRQEPSLRKAMAALSRKLAGRGAVL